MLRASAQIGEANSWTMHSGSGNSRFQSVMIGRPRLEEDSDRPIDIFEAFSDGVLAIVITIMVLELNSPR